LDIGSVLMLVLSRRLGERIVIGPDVVVTVVKLDRNQVRLGIEAPADVAVFREEIAPGRVSEATPEGLRATS
jgi:carbon storage regulator